VDLVISSGGLPMTPLDEARQAALEWPEAWEQITTTVDRTVLAETRKKRKPLPAEKLGRQLLKVLERTRIAGTRRCCPKWAASFGVRRRSEEAALRQQEESEGWIALLP
jgi:hypothetical protein